MTVFKRSRRIYSVSEDQDVKLAADETPKSAYKAWLAKFKATSRYCPIHKNTALVFNRYKSGFRQLDRQEDGPFGPFRERVPIPGAFKFHALFDCPACHMACALCPPQFHERNFETFAAVVICCFFSVVQVSQRELQPPILVKPATLIDRLNFRGIVPPEYFYRTQDVSPWRSDVHGKRPSRESIGDCD